MSILEMKKIRKSFDGTEVLRGLSLEVAQGEFLTLLGPSGCGKTTTLRIIAGLETPDSGRVLLDGRDVTDDPPEKRPVNTVFQNYALFPHMNVERNIGYGLRVRGAKRPEIARRVGEMLRMVQLEGFEKRTPDSLSGGQRQRVAIARSLVLEPGLLLLDEPLGALDLQLRRQMQEELKSLQTRLGIAFVYITHDQEEALNMSDRVAVMRDGRFEQVGTPTEIYEHPRTRFAAAFIGQTNLPEGEMVPGGFRLAGQVIPAQNPSGAQGKAALCLRMERVHWGADAPEGRWSLPAVLEAHRFVGGSMRATLVLADGQKLVAATQAPAQLENGAQTRVWWDENAAAVVTE